MRNLLLSSIVLLVLFLGACKKEKMENHLVGTWAFEYEILDDGTKKYDNPYALMEFTYSDGFFLKEDGTGSTIWFGNQNGEIEWSNTATQLIIHNQYRDGALTDYEYSISEVKSTSLIFENYKGHKYYMKKQ